MSRREQDFPVHRYDPACPYSVEDIIRAQTAAEDQSWAFNGWAMPHDHPSFRMSGYALTDGAPRASIDGMSLRRISVPSQFTPVPQVPFQSTSNQDVGSPGDYIEFKTIHGRYINLAQALHGLVDDLLDKDVPAFPKGSVSSKVSLRIQFEDRKSYHRQVMALRSTSVADPISRGKLATTIAKETLTYLGAQELEMKGRTFPFEKVFLVNLRRVSKGSWQPEFYVFF